MSDESVYHDTPKTQEYGDTATAAAPTEKVEAETVVKEDRGMFDFLGKKKPEEEKKYEEPVISSEYEQKVDHVPEPQHKSEEQPQTLFQKMNISHSDSSDDEECEDGEKKKKKKPLTERLKEKIEERKERKEEEMIKKIENDNCVPIEKYEEEVVAPPPPYTNVGDHTPTDVVHHGTPVTEEKKGFMEKLKEKLPGGHKKPVEEQAIAPPPTRAVEPVEERAIAPPPTRAVEERAIAPPPTRAVEPVEERAISPPPTRAVEPVEGRATAVTHEEEVVQPEKKGIFEKIKEKIPGYHSKSEEEREGKGDGM